MYTEIKNWEDACKAKGIDPNELPEVSKLPLRHQKAIIAFYKMAIIAEAINGDWQPNWNDWSQLKYFPWFDVEADEEHPSGSGLSYDFYDNSNTITDVGSRLCFASSEQAKYAATQFQQEYEEFMLIQQ
ncbi:hypothetical protein BH09BAC1_BH09BAC1_14300 [soil metagenome]